MEIKNLDINLILPYKNNPRKISDTAIEKVANSIKNFGFRQPIVVDKNNIVVVGIQDYKLVGSWVCSKYLF